MITAHLRSFFAHIRLVSSGGIHNEAVCVCQLCGLHDHILCGDVVTVGYVFANGACVEDRLLSDQCDLNRFEFMLKLTEATMYLVVQELVVVVADWDTVKQHFARERFVEVLDHRDA